MCDLGQIIIWVFHSFANYKTGTDYMIFKCRLTSKILWLPVPMVKSIIYNYVCMCVYGSIPGGPMVKESSCQYRRCRFDPWVRKIPWRRKWQATPVFLFGKCHGQRSLTACSPWGCKESDMTWQLNNNVCVSVCVSVYLRITYIIKENKQT